jgi:homoprotocatechuate degradation regulator HpaR
MLVNVVLAQVGVNSLVGKLVLGFTRRHGLAAPCLIIWVMSMPEPPLLRRNLPLLLLQVRELVMARFRPVLKEAGLTEQQWRVLRALLSEGPLEPRQIVAVCCLSSASLVGILVRMEDLGLIARQPVAGDQRRVLILPSPKGQVLATQMAPAIDAIYAQLESTLGPDLASSLLTTLDSTQARLTATDQNLACITPLPNPDQPSP